jgi:hypothetical protein
VVWHAKHRQCQLWGPERQGKANGIVGNGEVNQ